MLTFKNLLLTSIFLVILTSCTNKNNKTQILSSNKYAKHFSIETYPTYKILNIYEAWSGGSNFTYVLTNSKTTRIPDSLQSYPQIQIPLQRIIATSTTHLPALEAINQADKLIAFANTKYISSPLFRKKIDAGSIEEIGNGMQLNTEKILSLKPQLLMVFSSGQDFRNYNIFTQNNIPVLYNADWMENTPLGRAEWIKVFGVLFGAEKQTDSLFNAIEKKYLSIKNNLKNNTQKPSVFQGGKFGDKWYVPGGKSYATQLITDAGGAYLWKDDTHTGSIPLNFENILIRLPKAAIWLNPGMVPQKRELLQEIPQAKSFKSVINDRVYTYNLTQGATGGVTYFEYSNLHPDWVLDDLYHIFYPQTDNYSFHFYQKLPE